MMDSRERRARILAIDFGTKRLGLAISDPLGITAQGLPTLERTRLDDDLAHLKAVAAEYAVERVVMGNPLSHAGSETAMSQRVALFAEKLRNRLPCPVELCDERMTSVEANRLLRDSGIGIEKRRRAADRVAATLLLQGYLDYQANQRTQAAGPACAETSTTDTEFSVDESVRAESPEGRRGINDGGETAKAIPKTPGRMIE
jgi:putative holliday junction resolvase